MATKKAKLDGNNLLIVLLLVTLLVVGITALVGKSLFTSIVRDTKVVTAKAAAEKQLKANLVSAPKLVDAYNNMGSQKDVLADALPTTSDLPSLLVTYENIAAQAGIKLKSIGSTISAVSAVQPSDAQATGSIGATPQTYDIDFSFQGSYASLNKLFTAMELNARPMRVTSVSLNGSGSALSGDVVVETYFQDKAQLPIGSETIK